jgi:hypothetical protein
LSARANVTAAEVWLQVAQYTPRFAIDNVFEQAIGRLPMAPSELADPDSLPAPFRNEARASGSSSTTGVLIASAPSSDGPNDPTVCAQSRSIDGGRERTADRRYDGGDFCGVVKRRRMVLGRAVSKNCRSNSLRSTPFSAASLFTNSPTPSDSVGPGSTAFTVTAVPEVVSASPRDMASSAVFVIP